MPEDATIPQALDRLMRADGGRLLASLIQYLRDFQLAEDSLQDAMESALVHWQRNGLPRVPAAWLMQTARRKAIDRLRRDANFHSKQAAYATLLEIERDADEPEAGQPIPDERLRLIFTCCHPALSKQASVGLTLKALGGLSTEDVAQAFLVSAETMAQRLVRAKHKIAKAGIAYEVPDKSAWAERLEAVLSVLYLIFNAGYTSSKQNYIRHDLCEEAVRLTRILRFLCPNEPEVEGLLALMLLHHARSGARLSEHAEMVPLDEQDRSKWNRAAIGEGLVLVEKALGRKRPGFYQLQAAIAALHGEATSAKTTDWAQIVLIYDALIRLRPNPVFQLNRIVAVSHARGPKTALEMLDQLEGALSTYQPFHAARADILRRCGDFEGARRAYAEAISLSRNATEQQFLQNRLNQIAPTNDGP